MNWKKIIDTKAGAEFEKWLSLRYEYNYFKDGDLFCFDVYNGLGRMIPKNIINYLALEWLDVKGYKILPIPFTANLSEFKGKWRLNILNENNSCYDNNFFETIKEKNTIIYKTRSEAITEGVKKAFDILEGE